MLLHALLLAAGLTSPQCDTLKSATLPQDDDHCCDARARRSVTPPAAVSRR